MEAGWPEHPSTLYTLVGTSSTKYAISRQQITIQSSQERILKEAKTFGYRVSAILPRLRPPQGPFRLSHYLRSAGRENVGVTGINDGHGGATEELTAGGTELNL